MNIYGFDRKSFATPQTRTLLAVLIGLIILVYSLLFNKNMFGLIDINICEDLRIEIVNVGQGDCSIIRTPKGRTILIDGGTNVSTKEARQIGRVRIQDYLAKLGIDEIDAIVVTHWHIDDFSALIPVLNEYKVHAVYETANLYKNDLYNDFEMICEKKSIKRITVRAGYQLEMGDDVFIQVLNPEETFGSNVQAEINNDSIVLLVRYGKVQTLMCADIGEDAEREVVKYNTCLKSQIIKIPDHGADRSGYRPFFEMVDAKVGLISVGANNPFGYPSVKHLEYLEGRGTKLYRTDLNGNIHIRVGGKDENDFQISVDRKL